MVSIGKVFGFLGEQTVKAGSKMKHAHRTKVFTNDAGDVIRMMRPINNNGQEATAIWRRLEDGTTRLSIADERGFESIWRTKKITREPNGSIMGGDRITIDKDYTKYCCQNQKTKLIKDYNPDGVLEHKELNCY